MAEKSPFTFDVANPRWVTNYETPNLAYGLSAAMFLFSIRCYHRRFFRVDGNLINFMAFTAFSAPASYGYVGFFANSAENEAARINNQREASS